MSSISGQAVINYLKVRKSSIDFFRDVLETIIEDDKVVVKITDKISGGQSTYVTGVNLEDFESIYGNQFPEVTIVMGNKGIPTCVPVLMQYEFAVRQETHKVWRLVRIEPDVSTEYGRPYQGAGVIWLKNVVAWMVVPKI